MTPSQAPVFIIASPRSGSSMLRLMMTCHGQMHFPPECGFALWLQDEYGAWNERSSSKRLDAFLDSLFRTRKFETWNIPREELRAYLQDEARPRSYADLVASIYLLHARRGGKAPIRWGDKNNYYLEHILSIRSLFPDCAFLHIVRDARDVVCSYRELSGRNLVGPYAPTLPAQVEEGARDWQRNIETIEQSFRALDMSRVHRIRFEGLVEDPEDALRGVCEFLELGFDPAMLAFHEANADKQLEPEAMLQWKERTLQPLDGSRIGRYRDELSATQIAAVERVAGDGLRLHRYIE